MLKVDNTGLILIDYQGKLAMIMYENEDLLAKMTSLVKGAQLLDIPIIWLEQYPKGLGPTVNEIKKLLEDDDQKPIAKMDFNCCQNSEFQAALNEVGKENYLIAGIEAHICIYQTVRELLSEGKHVEYVQDAISSRTLENKQIGMEKMKLFGAYPTSVEMALFELMGTAEHPKFRDISKLIK